MLTDAEFKLDKAESASAMVSVIAHQWKQPITVLGMSVDYIIMMHEMGDLSDKELREFEQNARTQLSVISQSVDDFKMFFGINKTQKRFDLGLCVKQAARIYHSRLKNAKVEANINENSFVFGYSNEMAHALVNIFANALDACEENHIKPIIQVGVRAVDDIVIAEIQDNGGGFSEEALKHVLSQKFSTKGEKGLGLGLFLANEIVLRMKGTIEITNENGGAKVKISLPFAA